MSAPLRKEFYRSVAARLQPVDEDYDQFLVREDGSDRFRLCVEMTGIFSMERPWYLIADEFKMKFWRYNQSEEASEVDWESADERARVKQAVAVFMAFMSKPV